ncbi:class I adenylate-forming enzyme family protein [Virgibacillus kekensis]|uniref:Class I adenylate-forming enzyme family protein n=1 Tax=Virgibacillus kekensis TaxID=202261 RepID=A0ABV9DGB5_9BACI
MKTVIDTLFDRDSGKAVLATFNGNYTAEAMKEKVHYYEEILKDQELSQKKVGLLVPMIDSYLALFLAVNKLGGTVIPLSWQFRQEDLTNVLDYLDPHIVFTVEVHNGFAFGDAVQTWAESTNRETVVYTAASSNEWARQTYKGETKPLEQNDIPIIVCSSGSTGTPKGLICQPDFVDALYRVLPELTDFQPEDSVLLIAPPTSSAGLAFFLYGIYSGATVAFAESFDFKKMTNLVRDNKCNKIIGTPSIFKAIFQIAKELDPEILKNMKLVGLAGEKITTDYKDQFEFMDDCTFTSMYGNTEAGVIGQSVLEDKVEFTLLKETRHKIKDGELLIKSPTSFGGYYKNPELTKELFDENGWIFTGDMVRETEPGKFEMIGRKRDIIKKGGQQVVPAEVEKILVQYSKVKQAVVLGAPHDVFGEQIVGFIVPSGELDLKDLSYFCAQRIAGYKVPDHLKVLSEIPVSQGKVDKVTLRKMFMENRTEEPVSG